MLCGNHKSKGRRRRDGQNGEKRYVEEIGRDEDMWRGVMEGKDLENGEQR